MHNDTTHHGPSTSRYVKVRKAVRFIVPVAIVAALIAGLGTGTLCSVGYDAIAYVCPLGALESLFGAGAFVPRMLIALAAVVVVGLLVGKAFCSWVCPIPPLSDFLSSKKRRQADRAECVEAAKRSGGRWRACSRCSECSGCASGAAKAEADDADGAENGATSAETALAVHPKKQRGIKLDGRHLVLVGALGSSALCGFPVFCLVCPIGLTFATAIAAYRLVGFNEPTLELLIFPLLIVLELTILRKWCHRFCPVGALLSLIGSFSKLTRPKVDHSKCVRIDGAACNLCAAACPEHLDPCEDLGDRSLSECTRCGKCVQACPHGAVSFLGKKKEPGADGGPSPQPVMEGESRG